MARSLPSLSAYFHFFIHIHEISVDMNTIQKNIFQDYKTIFESMSIARNFELQQHLDEIPPNVYIRVDAIRTICRLNSSLALWVQMSYEKQKAVVEDFESCESLIHR